MNNLNKKLKKAYEKKLRKITSDFFSDNFSGLYCFIEHLKYLRDMHLLKIADNDTVTTTLTTAIAEFEAYKTETDQSKKVFHFNNFLELVKINLEEWVALNDSI